MPWERTVTQRRVPDEDYEPYEPREGDRVVLPTPDGRRLVYRTRLEPLVGGGTQVALAPIARQLPLPPGLKCKLCNSPDLVRFGTYRGVQRYRCRSCRATFMDNNALPGMRVPVDAVGAAVSMFYGGLSIRDVSRQLDQIFDVRPSTSTVYDWVIRYTEKARRIVGEYRPRVGDVWTADETVLKIGGVNTWFWDIVDEDTRFLLASHISLTRTIRDAETLMRRSLRLAGRAPRVIVTDKLAAYLEGIERTFGAATRHRQSGPFALERSTRSIERFHGTLKDRTKVMRGMANRETAALVTEGWLLHYNFVRGHEGLGGETPARAARVRVPFRNWAEVVRGDIS